MQLPYSLRDSLVEELEKYLEAVSASPDTEAVVAYVIELLETFGEDSGFDDIVGLLEDSGAIDGSLPDNLEEEMSSNDEFEFTGEEVVSLVERICEIEWEGDGEGGGGKNVEGEDEDDEDEL